jgi:hypothetical protein
MIFYRGYQVLGRQMSTNFAHDALTASLMGVFMLLAGCGVVSSFNRLNSDIEMGKSEAAYKACLADHPSDAAKACETARLAYQADVQAFSARTGTNLSVNTTNH